jgi:hypothetical protein
MKAFDFPTKVSPERTLEIPAPVPEMLPEGKRVRVILLVSEPSDIYEQQEWSHLTAREFFAGYADSDAMYDETDSCEGRK